MSNYNQLKITYQGGQETAITLTSSTIQYFEYQRQNIIAVEVPEIVETIGEYAFCDNNGLSSIVLNEGLQAIGNQAFQHGLYTAVTIPSTVTSIGENSFNMADEQYDDEHPFTVTCLAATPPTLDDSEGITFGLMRYLQAIYVPAESVDAYKAAFNWANYASKIQAIPVPPPEPPKPVYYRYIQSFETAADWSRAYADDKLGTPSVVYLEDEQRIVWNEVPEPPAPDYSVMPLTFEILSAGTIVWKAQDAAYTATIEYSKDNGSTWTSITSTTEGASIPVNVGDTVQFRGDNAAYASGTKYNTFGDSTAEFEVEGNIMSLIDSTGYTTVTTLASSNTFSYLLFGCTGLTSAENLVLPTMNLAVNCYANMFRDCASLTQAPELPATTLVNSCYDGMFYGCTSLTTAPELPATTLSGSCYRSMFRDCTSLTQAPELPVTTLALSCYRNMFQGCTSLTTAPELPATTLVNYCYNNMFQGCTSLNYIKCLATDISASRCTTSWVDGVASIGTFVKNPNMTGWTTGNNGIPTGWTVIDATI